MSAFLSPFEVCRPVIDAPSAATGRLDLRLKTTQIVATENIQIGSHQRQEVAGNGYVIRSFQGQGGVREVTARGVQHAIALSTSSRATEEVLAAFIIRLHGLYNATRSINKAA